MNKKRGGRLEALLDPRRLRQRCLAALTYAVDGYLRSPVFLAFMRYGLEASNEAQLLPARGFGTRGDNGSRRNDRW